MCPAKKSQTTANGNGVLKFGVAGSALALVATFTAMGLFTNLFRSKPTKENTETLFTLRYQEDWASYMSTIDNDTVGSIMVDLGLRPIVPVKSKDRLLKINVSLNKPSSNGLPQTEEHELLGSLSERLSQELKSSVGAVFAGHLFCQGTLSLYFYLGENSPYDGAVSKVFANYRNHSYSVQLEKEPDWQTYTELLYPLPIQMQSIHNRKVVDNLRNSGDILAKKRPVDHLIYFKNEMDIDHFLSIIKGNGFEVVSREPTELDGYNWSVLLRRDDPVDFESVDEYVLYLWQKAHEANGDYDGWGSTLIRE